MRLLTASLIFLTFFAGAQPSNKVYTAWANFKIDDGMIIWQTVYRRPGMSIDSIRLHVIDLIKQDLRYTLLGRDGDEYAFDIIDKKVNGEFFIYKSKMIIELKPEKFRITLKSIEMRGFDPQSALSNDRTTFSSGKLSNLSSLSNRLIETFDYKLSGKVLKKDW